MKKNSVSLMIVLFAAALYAAATSARIHPNLPEFRFNVTQSDENVSIDIFQGNKKIQILKADGVSVNYTQIAADLFKNGIWLEDFNFDGYKDLAVLVSQGVTGNFYVKVFIYDTAKKNFVHNADFSNIPSPRLDKTKRIIRGFEKGGAAGLIFKSTVYLVVRGQPVLQFSMVQDLLKSGDYKFFKRAVSERINGKLVVVCEFVVTVEGCTVKPVKIIKGTKALVQKYLQER
jgi:hypothetical protein